MYIAGKTNSVHNLLSRDINFQYCIMIGGKVVYIKDLNYIELKCCDLEENFKSQENNLVYKQLRILYR